MWVAGIDGCPAGWVVVFRSITDRRHKASIVASLAEVFSGDQRPLVAAVDIPIGLPAVSQAGGRNADRECRKLLGRPRQSSIFPAPSRAALPAVSFREACELEMRSSIPSKRINKQTFNIMGKIREADAIAHGLQGSLFECHPEMSFWAMNDRRAMPLPKKGRGNTCKAGESGSSERRRLLISHGYSEVFLSTRFAASRQCGADDLLDACAAAWTAQRILAGEAIRFPAVPDLDGTGLDMAIWA
jgi:predicted RNase H-like nuclease